jgi:hypothetical protein
MTDHSQALSGSMERPRGGNGGDDSMTADWQVIQGDALQLLQQTESESVDIICTSPPY